MLLQGERTQFAPLFDAQLAVKKEKKRKRWFHILSKVVCAKVGTEFELGSTISLSALVSTRLNVHSLAVLKRD